MTAPNDCTPECYEAVRCRRCGNALPPRGRSVPLAMNPPQCCMEERYEDYNKRHLWSREEYEQEQAK